MNKIPETPDEIAEHIRLLAETEIIHRIIKGDISPDKIANQDFMYGVCVGIALATEKFPESIPEPLRKIVMDAMRQNIKKENN